ncbi:MAG: LLM class F420-dependent oxidoreductase [Actinomycetota bacterium]
MLLKIGIEIPYTDIADREGNITLAKEAEDLGFDSIWCSEVYTYDAFTTLAHLAGHTSTLRLGTNIAQIYARTPALTATSAAALDQMSNGRFILGLGASGPQVIEGWHGVDYDKPVQRTREIIDICRIVWRGERLEYEGEGFKLPGGKTKGGKGLKLINSGHRPDIPCYVASLGPKNVEMTAELADGWLPFPFSTEKAAEVFGPSLQAGKAKRAASLGPLTVSPFAPLWVGDKKQGLEAARALIGFYIGGMGSKDRNFYNRLAQRYGFVEEARKVQDLFLGGDKAAAIAATPDELVEQVCVVGDVAEVRDRLQAFQAAGATELVVAPIAGDPATRLEMLRGLAKANA